MMRRRNVLCSLLVLALSACNILSGKCTYEIRSLDGTGAINENGTELAAAQVTLAENRGSIIVTSLQWLVTGTTLKGHVLSAALKDASDLTQVRLDLPLAGPARPDISSGAVETRTGANLGGVHDLLAAGRGVIELRTDIASRPTVPIPITAQRVGDWVRPYCS